MRAFAPAVLLGAYAAVMAVPVVARQPAFTDRFCVWSNYMLISTQWRGAAISPLFEHGEVPRFLANTTMESYLQDDPAGTCLGCHAAAATAAGKPSNFTFLLRKAR